MAPRSTTLQRVMRWQFGHRSAINAIFVQLRMAAASSDDHISPLEL
jgi:hypothetical protein